MLDYLIYSVEDDKDIATIINRTLTKQGYEIETFYDGTTFLEAFKSRKPDMILLDMMLPDYRGTEILKLIRDNPDNDDIDIIIISANHMVIDKVEGLDLGADDYIEKPFDLLELMSRIQARFRRRKRNLVYKYEALELDTIKRELKIAENKIDLTNREYDLLVFLFKNKGKTVSREEIFLEIWNSREVESRTIDMHIKSLRKKLDSYGEIIQTIYGIGYKLL